MPIATIGLKYGTKNLNPLRLQRRFWNSNHKSVGEFRQTALQPASCLLELNIARPSVYVQQHSAISNFTLDVVPGQRPLGSDLMIVKFQRS